MITVIVLVTGLVAGFLFGVLVMAVGMDEQNHDDTDREDER